MSKRKKSEKSQSKRERKAARAKRKKNAKKLAGTLAKGFARWCGVHMPKGTPWEDAAEGMPAVMAEYLFSVFPSMGREKLDGIAIAHVHASAERLRVDMPGIADVIIAAGGAIN